LSARLLGSSFLDIVGVRLACTEAAICRFNDSRASCCKLLLASGNGDNFDAFSLARRKPEIALDISTNRNIMRTPTERSYYF
jgi:hypothetical protein